MANEGVVVERASRILRVHWLQVVPIGVCAVLAYLLLATSARAEGIPRWVSEGTQVNGSITVKTSGTLKFTMARRPTCKVKDKEVLTNPASMEEAGTDEITFFKTSHCTPEPGPGRICHKFTVIASGLPWRSHLVYKSGLGAVVDVIEGMSLTPLCDGQEEPPGGPKDSMDEAVVGTNLLEFGRFIVHNIEGNDSLKGNGKNKTISALAF
jgi:hypothetical protein